ncbi:zinc ABC transporter substrate-binding protein [Pseudogemmobacter humi]|uniref:High-affinity zinc uptake system protein ZnuA n=1 Tax=Pseudogemmobacter humi TaxID=2483812 RepID=A0A3P5X2N0_9RHOB|nr:zinc ABC transporter substrate-binding protein [Pseudogemmobacter humi]VDC28648.1 High-affinity zinc uptake system protein ZnuA precursor [Pseudogemmobacter humi]
MRYIISLPLTSLGLALCTGAALADVPQVMTDIPPVHSLVARVMGDLGTPGLLLTPGASEHHFQLRPSQAQGIAAADLVVMVGPGLTPWLDPALALRPDGAPLLGLLAAEGTFRRDYAAGGGHDDHDHAHGHDEEDHDHAAAEDHGHDDHAEAGHDHDHGHAEAHDHDDHAHDHSHEGVDPHAWLDPENGRLWLGLIAAELSRLDPVNAATYAANAARGAEEIAAADAAAREALTPVKDRPFGTYHDAFGYYAAHYGLNLQDSIAAGDASTPGAKHLSELSARVAAGEILCLFPEAGHDLAAVERMAEGSGARIGGALDPVGTAMEPGPGLYPALIRTSAETIAACLTP